MSIFNSFDDLINNAAATADFAKRVSTEAVKKYCGIRAKYPTTTSVFTPLDFIAEGICSQFGVPTQPISEPPFLGGQCLDKVYDVEGQYLNSNTKGAGCDAVLRWTVNNVAGRIVGVGIDTLPAIGSDDYLVLFYQDTNGDGQKIGCKGASGSILIVDDNCIDRGNAGSRHCKSEGFSITQIATSDGSPDDCGNPDIEPPPDPTIDPNDFTVIFNYEYNTTEGDKNYDITITFDPEKVNFKDDIPFVVYDPIQNKSFDGDIGKEGVDIDPEGSKDGDEGGNPTGDESSDINITYKTPFTVKIPYLEEEKEDVEEEEKEMEPGEITWILIEVTTLPKGHRTILFENSDNNTFFAGYISWTVTAPGGKFRYPEMPIRKPKNAFEVPQNVDGYVAYAVNGAKLKITEYKVAIPSEEEGEEGEE